MCSSTIAAMLTASVPAGVASTRYGIVFDAGSSGSRIHVYSWSTGGGGPKNDFNLIDDDLLKIKPGLSAYKDDPGAAGASLRPLLEHAKKRIPPALVSSAPAFLMATAGLRMVGEAKKDAILASVCTELAASGFTFKCEWATLLSGQDEGLFGWVTVNYLLDRLYPPPASEPVGTIDLGGGCNPYCIVKRFVAIPRQAFTERERDDAALLGCSRVSQRATKVASTHAGPCARVAWRGEGGGRCGVVPS